MGRPRRRQAIWLAMLWGRLDVDNVIAELTPDAFDELQAFVEMYGLGPRDNDLRFAKLGMIASKGYLSVQDLMHKPRWEQAAGQSREEVVAQWEGFAARRRPKRSNR